MRNKSFTNALSLSSSQAVSLSAVLPSALQLVRMGSRRRQNATILEQGEKP